jgi:hypothetical protein
LQRDQQARHRADQELRKIRRDLFDHVLGQMRNVAGRHLHLVDRAARRHLEAGAGRLDLHRHALAIAFGMDHPVARA